MWKLSLIALTMLAAAGLLACGTESEKTPPGDVSNVDATLTGRRSSVAAPSCSAQLEGGSGAMMASASSFSLLKTATLGSGPGRRRRYPLRSSLRVLKCPS